jgi:hypothetical protein
VLTFYHVFTGDQYCSNNIVSTVTSLIDAIWADVLTVGRLLAVCFGKRRYSNPCPYAWQIFVADGAPCPIHSHTNAHCITLVVSVLLAGKHGLGGCVCQMAVSEPDSNPYIHIYDTSAT